MTEMFGEAWPPMSVPDLAPGDDDDVYMYVIKDLLKYEVLLTGTLVAVE